jgi:hypothetical protein
MAAGKRRLPVAQKTKTTNTSNDSKKDLLNRYLFFFGDGSILSITTARIGLLKDDYSDPPGTKGNSNPAPPMPSPLVYSL